MSTIIFEDRISVPDGIGQSLESFRQWACSDTRSDHVRASFLNGQTWVEQSMEELFRHNQLLTRILLTLGHRIPPARGYLFHGRVYYTNVVAGLSTEPDLLFVSAESIRGGDVEFTRKEDGRTWEVQGTADLTLEIVSKTSARKDLVLLRELYHRAGVREYWLIDSRKSPARFEILRWLPDSYESVEAVEGWVRSDVLDCSFRLDESSDPLGNPLYTLAVR